MSQGNNYSEQLRKYLAGEMSHEEAHAFERAALDDPFLQDAIDGASEIPAGQFAQGVAELNEQIHSSTAKKAFPIWRVAASVSLLILGSFAVWFMMNDVKQPQLANESVGDETEELIEIPKNNVPSETKEEEFFVEDRQTSDGSTSEEKTITSEPEVSANESLREKDIDPPIASGFIARNEELEDQELDPMSDALAVAEEPSSDDIELASGFSDEDAVVVQEIVAEEKESAKADIQNESARKKADNSKRAKSRGKSRSFFKTSSEELVQQKAKNQRKVAGVVSDNNGEPLPGVNVVVKGTTTGVTTDLDGNYSIETDEEDDLVFSSVGMSSQEVAVGARSAIDVSMSADVSELQEVVVTGYGVTEKGEPGYEQASPVSGWKEFEEYLEENLFYPEEAISKGIKGRVVLLLTISVTGNVRHIEVKRSLEDGCDEEAIRLINEGPMWNPASRDGISVESTQRVRIKFDLED